VQAWAARTALVPAWAREMRTVEALPLGVERFRGVTTPTLLLLGTETEPHHVEATEALHAALPNSEVALLTDQGHTALVAAPDQVCDAVLPFLAAHSRPVRTNSTLAQ
jgi:pimeloyl-ACP methyl ester carboxylesterase